MTASSHGPKPCEFIGFGDIHGPKPYELIGFGDIHGPKPYEFIGFGDIEDPSMGPGRIEFRAPDGDPEGPLYVGHRCTTERPQKTTENDRN